MKVLNKAVIPASLCLILLFTCAAFACRYTVRDIGFVAIRGPEFSLVLKVGQQDAARFEAAIPELKRALANSNIEFQAVVDQKKSTSNNSANEKPELMLLDRLGREFPIEISQEVLLDVELFQREVIDHVFGKVLRKVCDNSLDSFAHIIVLEGTDSAEAIRVRAMVEEAVGAIRKIEPMLPRPIAHPLRVVFIPQPDYSDEKLLDWALRDKQSAATQTLVPETARVAVLYGKGRLAGSVLSGDAISAREILGQLALVGESCECETSREWMKEGSIPFLWNAKQAQAAPNELGFDPHSPLVRAEMIRIVSQGPKAKSDSTDATSAGPSDAIERLLIGYSEAALGTKRSSENAAAVDATPNLASLPENAASSLEISTIPSQVVANVQLGNSWDLDEPTTTFPSSTSVVSPPNNPIDNSTSTIASEKPICEECLEGELPNDFSASQSLTLASAQSESPDPGSAFPNWAVIATTLAFLTFASIAIASWILFLK